MTSLQLVVVGAAVLAASFTQIVTGFGFALLCMPIMTLAVPVERAVVVSTLVGLASASWQTAALRADIDRPLARRMSVGALVGMPLGLLVLNVLSDTALRLLLGVSVLLATALLVRRIDLRAVGRPLDYTAGFFSGVLNTSLTTNGPPLVFALQARHIDPDRFRATLAAVFSVSGVVTFGLFLLDGKVTGDGLRASAVAVPAWLIGQAGGWPLRRRVPAGSFRVLVLVLLAAAGCSAIVAALV